MGPSIPDVFIFLFFPLIPEAPELEKAQISTLWENHGVIDSLRSLRRDNTVVPFIGCTRWYSDFFIQSFFPSLFHLCPIYDL